MNLDGLIVDANIRLKNQNLRVKIAKRGSVLYLRAYVPSKNGEPGLERQDINLGLTASLTGLHLAEAEAIKIGVSVNAGIFSWEPYIKSKKAKTHVKTKNKTIKEWVE